MIEVIGFDHIYLAVSDMVKSEEFYDRVMPILGFRKNHFALGDEGHIQYFNRHFGFVIRPAKSQNPHDSKAPGLHHFCFRVDSIDEVIQAATDLKVAGVDVSEPKNYPEYAPDYWGVFFDDPDGIALEITNYRQQRRLRHDNWGAPDIPFNSS